MAGDLSTRRSSRASRRYATPKRDQRAAATRRTILAAAETLFLRDGYARTSMKAIAAQAGVSEKTMYLAFGTKATLLRQVIQLAVQGDEAPVPLSERPEWRAVVAGPSIEIFATLRGDERGADDPHRDDHRARRDSGRHGSRAGDVPRRAHTMTRESLHALAAELQRRGALRSGVSVQDAADLLYAIAADESVFLRLTRDCGWTPDRYADLIAHTLRANLGTG